jgi:hypothetical protein
MSPSKFPKFTKSRQIGEIGVNAVSTIVNDKLRWIFRRVNQEHDFGVDGHIDIVQDDGSVTGQSMAVQIKTGDSFFTSETEGGFTYYGEDKHLNYYLNMPTPLILVICEPESRLCYWTQFDVRKSEKIATGWKITVPKNSVLSELSKETLLEIVGPAIDHREAIESHWAVNETLQQFDFVLYAVDRHDVETGNVAPLADFVGRIVNNDNLCRRLQGHVELTIDGYNDDPRELWEISEVINWYAQADPVFRYWFYFLATQMGAHGLCSYWACMCSGKRARLKMSPSKKIKVELNKERLLSLLNENWLRLNEMTERLGLPESENMRISFEIMDALQLPGR